MKHRRKRHLHFIIGQGYTCAYCGAVCPAEELTIDHRIPVSKGGADGPDNWLVACYGCNCRKSGMNAVEFKAYAEERRSEHLRAAAYFAAIAGNILERGLR